MLVHAMRSVTLLNLADSVKFFQTKDPSCEASLRNNERPSESARCTLINSHSHQRQQQQQDTSSTVDSLTTDDLSRRLDSNRPEQEESWSTHHIDSMAKLTISSLSLASISRLVSSRVEPTALCTNGLFGIPGPDP